MLAGSVRAYATRYGVAAGTNIAVFTNNDSGWQTAVELVSKGINVTAVIDPRDTGSKSTLTWRCNDNGSKLFVIPKAVKL
jgi:sarcosine oxidase subunit alpha